MPTSQDAGNAITINNIVLILKTKLSSVLLKQIITLFKKDLLLEIRQQYSFYGILLYIGATIFVLFMAVEAPEGNVWSGLFWVIQLFICINAVAKSFLQESRGRMLYFYSVASPVAFVLAKLLFNTLLMFVMSLLSLLLFTMFLGNPMQKVLPFVGLVVLGGWSISLVFSFLAAIAARAQQNAAIMAILGFPIIIPQLVLLMRLSNTAFAPLLTIPMSTVLLLIALDFLIILLAVILFPFLWKD
ncbi:MAG TPA: heme exporter protein CcmB [Chitinophagaceae bacterium]|jgi:heme exporter protein B|nr:heme exporter protein CcmB [Chitinophagaceae bacterium]HMU58216.1 heme exporter protein CcmB [Chitinophagaceae bacterium]